MEALLDIKDGTSLEELKKAYDGKRQRYLREKKSTSAKPRIRLLQDKIDRLDSAYNKYLKKVEGEEQNSAKSENLVSQTEIADESRGLNTVTQVFQSPDSLQKIKIYPILSVNGHLIENEKMGKLCFSVGKKETYIEKEGFFEVSPGEWEIKLKNKKFTSWKTMLNVQSGYQAPLMINLTEVTKRVKIDISPRVEFNIFLNKSEIQKTLEDDYRIPVYKENIITIRSKGFKDYHLLLNAGSSKDERLQVILKPLPENADIVKARFPLMLKHFQSGKKITILKGNSFSFGRGKSSCIKLSLKNEQGLPTDELFISRNHFTVQIEDERFYIEDQSSNGTFLNGEKINSKKAIPINELIEIGIFHPVENKVLIKKILFVHEVKMNSKSGSKMHQYFMSVYNNNKGQKQISHILMPESFAELRKNKEKVSLWISSIMEVISTPGSIDLNEPSHWEKQS